MKQNFTVDQLINTALSNADTSLDKMRAVRAILNCPDLSITHVPDSGYGSLRLLIIDTLDNNVIKNCDDLALCGNLVIKKFEDILQVLMPGYVFAEIQSLTLFEIFVSTYLDSEFSEPDSQDIADDVLEKFEQVLQFVLTANEFKQIRDSLSKRTNVRVA